MKRAFNLSCLLFIVNVLLPRLEAEAPSSKLEKIVDHETSELFLNSKGQLTSPVIELLKLDNLYDPQDTLQDVVAKTQKQWLAVRTGIGGKERRDLVDTELQQLQLKQVEAIAHKMGIFNPKPPRFNHYNYGICLGAFLETVRIRLAMLVDLWKQGVRFDTLVFLSGERDLRKNEGDIEAMSELCHPKSSPLTIKKNWKLPAESPYASEYDMVRLVWDQTEIPEDMAEALKGKVIFVNASRGDKPRASTYDTYKVWLQEYQPPGGTLLVPNHPYIWPLQDLIGKNVLGNAFILDTVTPEKDLFGYDRKNFVSLFHDTIAKCLYELSRSRNP